MIDAGAEDLEVFTEHTLGFANANHHKVWYQLLENRLVQDKGDLDERGIGKLRPAKPGETNNSMVIEAPRNHAKSTCFAVNYPLWEVIRNRNVRIVLVTKELEQSMAFLREIKGHIERNEKLIARYGRLQPQMPEKWTDRSIIVERDNLRLKDPTITCVGTGGSILSKRADIIIADDLLNIENTRTPEQRFQTFDWFVNVLLPVLEPDGRIIIDGTVWQEMDLMETLMDDPTYDVRIRGQAIIKEADRQDLWDEFRDKWKNDNKVAALELFEREREEMLKGAIVLWHDRWPYDKLMMKRASMGERAFQRQYQNTVEADQSRLVKEQWIKRACERGANRRLLDTVDPLEYLVVVGGLDPAAGKSELEKDESSETGWSCIFTLGVDRKTNMRTILNIMREQWESGELRRNIIDQHNRFKWRKLRVESNAFQKTLVSDLKLMKDDSSGAGDLATKVHGVDTGSEKWDADIGLDSLALLFENDKIIVPYDRTHARTIRTVDIFLNELRKLGQGGHTGDTIMAFWLADRCYRELPKVPTARVKGSAKGIYDIYKV